MKRRRGKVGSKRRGIRKAIRRIAVAAASKLRKLKLEVSSTDKKDEDNGSEGNGSSCDGSPAQREFTYQESRRASKKRIGSSGTGEGDGEEALTIEASGSGSTQEDLPGVQSTAKPLVLPTPETELAPEELERRKQTIEARRRREARERRRLERLERERRENARRLERERLAREKARKGYIAELEVPEFACSGHDEMQLGA